MKEQFELKSLLLNRKKALRKYLQRQNLLENFRIGFPASSNRCRCTAAYSCNLANRPRVKSNQEMIVTAKNTYTHVAIQVQAFRSKPKKLRLFSRNNKSSNRGTEQDHLMVHDKLHLWSNPVRKHLQKHNPQELITQYAWNRPAS